MTTTTYIVRCCTNFNDNNHFVTTNLSLAKTELSSCLDESKTAAEAANPTCTCIKRMNPDQTAGAVVVVKEISRPIQFPIGTFNEVVLNTTRELLYCKTYIDTVVQ